MVQNALEDWNVNQFDSCSLKMKPLKYPTIFNSADVAIITKSDLADAVEFDEAAARRNIQSVRPGMAVFKISAKTGEGIAEHMNFLDKRRSRSRVAAAV
jgi:hydrogenase nickel incorporation protein HypB